MRSRRAAATLLFALTCAPLLAQQQPADRQAARDRELLRRAQAAQKQAEEARTFVEAEKGRLAEQLQNAESTASKTAGALSRERKRADDLQRGLDEAAGARDLLRKERDGLSARLASIEEQLRDASAELSRIRRALAERDGELAEAKAFAGRENAARTDAEQKNVKLYVLSRELIERYRSQGFWDAVRRKEPFTGLKQVEVENLLEQYRDRADEARVIPQTRR
jgi:chromosome segregation ATPase